MTRKGQIQRHLPTMFCFDKRPDSNESTKSSSSSLSTSDDVGGCSKFENGEMERKIYRLISLPHQNFIKLFSMVKTINYRNKPFLVSSCNLYQVLLIDN